MEILKKNGAKKVAAVCLALGLGCFTTTALAEYYLVTSGSGCGNVCTKVHKPRVKYCKTYKKYKPRKHHVRHCRPRRTYVTVQYAWAPPACCGGCCAPSCVSGCEVNRPISFSDTYVFTRGPYDSSYNYWNEGYRYYPDLATGDDNPYFYPGMEMDY